MASITRRPDGAWRGRYRDDTGREHARHFGRKVDADRWLVEQQSKVNRGEWVDPALGRIRVRDWAPTWLKSKRGLKPRARDSYESLWRTVVEPRWGAVPLTGVTYAEVVAWVGELNGELSPSRIGQALLVLKQLLNLAVLDGRLARNVATPVKPPRACEGEQRFLTHAQLAQLAGECGRAGDQYRVLVLLAGYTGLRWGELRALRVRHLDLLRARLDVSENIPDRCDEAQTVAPKSHKRRVVPFPRVLVDDLAGLVAGKRAGALVFVNAADALLDNSNFRRNVFNPAVRALGLAPFTPHNLRDTAASLAVSAGASVKAVQRMLGHASAAMTLDVYAGLFSDDLDRVAEQLNEKALAAAADSVRTGGSTLTPLRPVKGA